MACTGAMPTTKQVQRSVPIPAGIAQQAERLAKRRRPSDNRVLAELIEQGIEATKQREQMFCELRERFPSSKDPDVVKKLGDELGRFVFGRFAITWSTGCATRPSNFAGKKSIRKPF